MDIVPYIKYVNVTLLILACKRQNIWPSTSVEEVCAVARKILIDDFILSNVYSLQLLLLHHSIAALSNMDSTTT